MEAKDANKIISITGNECGAVAYFLGRMLATSDEAVLIIDNSEYHDLYDSIWKAEIRDIAYRNIVIAKNTAYTNNVFDAFAYIVVYHGMVTDAKWWYASTDRIIITDFSKPHIRMLHQYVGSLDPMDVTVTFTDRVSGKSKDVDVVRSIGIERDRIMYSFEIPFSEDDRARIQEFQYNGVQKLGSMSKGYVSTLGDLYFSIVGKDTGTKLNKLVSSADSL